MLNTVSKGVRRNLWQWLSWRVLTLSDNYRAFEQSGVSATVTQQSFCTPTIHLTIWRCCLLLPNYTHTIPNRKSSQHLRSSSPSRRTRRPIVDTQTGIKLCPIFRARNQSRRHSTSGGNALLHNHTQYEGSTQRLTLSSWKVTWIIQGNLARTAQ